MSIVCHCLWAHPRRIKLQEDAPMLYFAVYYLHKMLPDTFKLELVSFCPGEKITPKVSNINQLCVCLQTYFSIPLPDWLYNSPCSDAPSSSFAIFLIPHSLLNGRSSLLHVPIIFVWEILTFWKLHLDEAVRYFTEGHVKETITWNEGWKKLDNIWNPTW